MSKFKRVSATEEEGQKIDEGGKGKRVRRKVGRNTHSLTPLLLLGEKVK